jgi:hypothetical protein
MESNRGATTFLERAGRDGGRQVSMDMDVLDTRARELSRWLMDKRTVVGVS